MKDGQSSLDKNNSKWYIIVLNEGELLLMKENNMPYRDGNIVRDDYGNDVSNYSSKKGRRSGGHVEGAAASAGGAGFMLFLGLLAAIDFVGSNLLYILILGGIHLVRTFISRAMKRIGLPLLIRFPINLVTFAILLAAMGWSIWHKSYGMAPVIQGSAIVQRDGDIISRMYSQDDVIGSLEEGERIAILNATRSGSHFKIETASGIVGFTRAGNIQNREDFIFHRQGFWDRMAEFHFTPREFPLVPGRYESNGNLVLVLNRARDSSFEARIPSEVLIPGRSIGGNANSLYIHRPDAENWRDAGGAVSFSLEYIENRPPIERNGGVFNYTLRIDLKNPEFRNEPEVTPFLHYLGDYILTSKSSFVKDGIEWTLAEQVSNRLF
jgi:hypothetical protein